MRRPYCQQANSPKLRASNVIAVAFSPDGTRLITASRDHTARVYALRFEDLLTIAQSRVTRTLFVEECQKYLHVATCPSE